MLAHCGGPHGHNRNAVELGANLDTFRLRDMGVPGGRRSSRLACKERVLAEPHDPVRRHPGGP